MIALNPFARDEYKINWLRRVNILAKVVAYLICGITKYQLMLNSLNKYYTRKLKILFCINCIQMFPHC